MNDIAPIHRLAEQHEDQIVELANQADRIANSIGLGSDPPEETTAGGPTLRAILLRSTQTANRAIAVLSRLEQEFSFDYELEPEPEPTLVNMKTGMGRG
jgi:hypothetical protein